MRYRRVVVRRWTDEHGVLLSLKCGHTVYVAFGRYVTEAAKRRARTSQTRHCKKCEQDH